MWRALCGESINRSARVLRASSAASTSNSKPPQACSLASLRSAAGWQEPVRWFASEPALEPETREIKSPKLEKIVEEICGLNLLEVADLTELLQKRLNLNPAILAQSFAPAQGAVPAQAAAAEVAAEPEKTEFDVKLTGYEAAAKIKIIKEVRGITALGLKEAKDLVEKAPVTIKSSLKKEEADELVKKLEAVGAKVALE